MQLEYMQHIVYTRGGYERMKTKQLMAVLIAMIGLLMLSGLATAFSGTMTMNISSTDTLAGSALMISFGTNVATTGLTNVSLYASAADTNATAVFIINSSVAGCALNTTYGNCNFTIETTAMEDSSEWVFYAIGKNGTDATDTKQTSTATAVIVDNSNPTKPTALSPAADEVRNQKGDVTFTSTVTSRNTTHGYIEFKGRNPGKSVYVDQLEASGALSITVKDMPEGTYEWKFVATDGADTKSSAYQTFTIDHVTSGGKVVYYTALEQQQQAKQKNIALVLIVAAIVIIVMKRKGK